MTLSWGFRHKLMYSGVILLVALLAGLFIWFKFFTTTPTCFDGKQDGGEAGVDCGGTCALVCSGIASAPVVLWARAFQNGPQTYTAAAYIQNNNGETGAHNVHYTFQLFDADNMLVVEKDGVTDIPPVQTTPIVEPTIDTGNRTVTHALFAFNDTPVWERVPHGSVIPPRIVSQVLAPDASRLTATIENDTVTNLSNVGVIAVLFDANGVALAASKSVLPQLAGRATADVVFTWPQGVQYVARADISVLPSF